MLAAASANASAFGLTNVGTRVCDVDDLPFGGRRHPIGEPLRGHDGRVEAVAGGALPDGTPVIISGSWDSTVGGGGWPTAPNREPLDLPESVRAVAVHGNVIITADGADIAVHRPALPPPMR